MRLRDRLPNYLKIENISDYQNEPDYLIHTSATTVFARNGSTGVIDFENSDAATLFKQVNDALTAGGRVYIKPGTYTISKAITFNQKSVTWEGPNLGTASTHGVVKLVHKAGATFTPMLTFSDYNISLRHLFVDGNVANGAVGGQTVLWSGNDGVIENVGILNAPSKGLDVTGDYLRAYSLAVELSTTYGLKVLGDGNIFYGSGFTVGNTYGAQLEAGASFNKFIGCNFFQNTVSQFVFYSAAGICRGNMIQGCQIGGGVGTAEHGILSLGGQENIIIGNTFLDCGDKTDNTYDGINLDWDATNYSTYNIIHGNMFLSDDAKLTRYAINEVAANDDYNSVIGNVWKNMDTGGYRIQGVNSIDQHNEGTVV